MSHPDPSFDPENVRTEDDIRAPKAKRFKGLTPSQLKKYSHKLLREGGVVTKAKHEALRKKMGDKLNANTGRRLTKAESKEKSKNWPRSKGPMTTAERIKFLGE